MAKELILIPKTKYELLTTKSNYEPQTIPTLAENVLQPTDELSGCNDQLETILKYAVSKNVLNKALGLWNYFKDRKGPLINWDEHGELTIKDNVVSGRHLIDLLKHTVSTFSKREPTGYEQFRAVLQEMHAPMGFIAHKVETSESQAGLGYVKGKTERGPPGRKKFRWIPY